MHTFANYILHTFAPRHILFPFHPSWGSRHNPPLQIIIVIGVRIYIIFIITSIIVSIIFSIISIITILVKMSLYQHTLWHFGTLNLIKVLLCYLFVHFRQCSSSSHGRQVWNNHLKFDNNQLRKVVLRSRQKYFWLATKTKTN